MSQATDADRFGVSFVVSRQGTVEMFDADDWLDRNKRSVSLLEVQLPPFYVRVPQEGLTRKQKQEIEETATSLAMCDTSELAALRAMLAWTIVAGDVVPSSHVPLSAEMRRQLATLDVESALSVPWETLLRVWDMPWQLSGLPQRDDQPILVIPTWQNGIHANQIDERSLWALMNALIDNGDIETIAHLVDLERVRQILGVIDSPSRDAPDASHSNTMTHNMLLDPSWARWQWVTTPFGWIRIGSRANKRTASR